MCSESPSTSGTAGSVCLAADSRGSLHLGLGWLAVYQAKHSRAGGRKCWQVRELCNLLMVVQAVTRGWDSSFVTHGKENMLLK